MRIALPRRVTGVSLPGSLCAAAAFPVLGVFLWSFWRGALAADLWHLLWTALLGALLLAGRRLYVSALLVLLLGLPVAWHFAVQLPAAAAALAEPSAYLRLEGTIRQRSTVQRNTVQHTTVQGTLPQETAVPEPEDSQALGSHPASPAVSAGLASGQRPPEAQPQRRGVLLLLSNVRLWPLPAAGASEGGDGVSFALAEAEVFIEGASAWGLPYRRTVRIGVPAAGLRVTGPTWARPRLALDLSAAEHHLRAVPLAYAQGEGLRLHLADRAAYYLSPHAVAVYGPVLLGLRDHSTPEAREVVSAFRRVGVAHLFAISGLHVGLLYGLFLALARIAGGLWRRGQGWAHEPALTRVGVLALVWAYIALIGWPAPALRAAVMGSLLVWSGLWGTRSHPFHVLALAALGMLWADAGQFYDLSYRLSFLAYLLLSWALAFPLPPALRIMERSPAQGRPAWAVRMLGVLVRATVTNLWVTTVITLGLWPLISAVFGQVSLLVFVGNLVLVPLLGLLVLPLGLVALSGSLLLAGAPPEAWLERALYAPLEPALSGWVWLVQALEHVGSVLVLPIRVEWSAGEVIAYYAAVLSAMALARRFAARRWEAAPSTVPRR